MQETIQSSIAFWPRKGPRFCSPYSASSVKSLAQPAQSSSPTPMRRYSANAASISSRGYVVTLSPRMVMVSGARYPASGIGGGVPGSALLEDRQVDGGPRGALHLGE